MPENDVNFRKAKGDVFMKTSNKAQRGLAVALLVAMVISAGFAAEQGQRGERGQRGPDSGRGGFDREAMQERMMTMMQERMGASDEEWTVIKPRLSEVMELSRNANSSNGMRNMMGRGGRGGRGGDRGDRGGRDTQQSEEETSAVQKASTELQETLEKEAPSAAEIKAKLTALRGAREKAKQELVTSQKKLREVLTLKQEAQLVMMGLLD